MRNTTTPTYATLLTPIGEVGFSYTQHHLLKIELSPERPQAPQTNDPFWARIQKEIDLYFKNPKHFINLPYSTDVGTPFCHDVWKLMREIPSGQTKTYGELAACLETSPRAIGNACRHNLFPLLIPCHRITAKEGPGGFFGARTGHWLNIKAWLLTHEREAA